MSPPCRASRRILLALLALPWQTLPAAAQVRVAPVDVPFVGAPSVPLAGPAAPPSSAPGAPALSSPLSAVPSLVLAPSLAAPASASPAAKAGGVATAAAARGGVASAARSPAGPAPGKAAALAAPSRSPAAAPSAEEASSNRFWSDGLARALGELARFAAPLPAPLVSLEARPAEEPPARLAPAASAQARRATIPIPSPRQGRLRDAWLYSSIYLSSLYWYTGPRLVERWDEIRERLAETAGRPRAVKDIRGFFIAHRVLGSTGSYSPLGFRVASNRLVVHDALAIYDRYFVEDDAARAAFLGMMQRAERYNPNRRSTQYRKAIFHALREAAVLEPSQVAASFDAQLAPERSARLEEFQRTKQQPVLAAFGDAVNAVITELNREAPPGERVVGALLLGSFANGAAGPGSDLDVQAISEGGSTRYNDEFVKRLKSRWKKGAYSDNPVSTFQYALPISKRLITRVHREPYLIFSPYPEVHLAVIRTEAEEAADLPSRIRTVRGWLFQKFYSVLLWLVLAGHDLKVLAVGTK